MKGQALSRCDAKIANGLRHADFQAAMSTWREVLARPSENSGGKIAVAERG
jgi:hypothetical protein